MMRQQIIDLFTKHPYFASRKLKNLPELMEWITENSVLVTTGTQQEMAYSAVNQDNGICDYGEKKKFVNFSEGYSSCGGICRCVIQKRKQTNLEKYGVEFAQQASEIKDRTKQTNLEKYGTTCSLHSPEVREKTKQTNLDRYGVEWALQSSDVQEKRKQTNLEKYGVENVWQSDEVKETIKQTNLERYGVEHGLQSPEIRSKGVKTNLEKYGVDHSSKFQEIQDKKSQTNILRYGSKCALQSSVVQEKSKQTNLEKYGVEHPSQQQMPIESLEILQDKQQLEELLKTNTFWNIGKLLEASDCTVARYANSHGLESPNIRSQPELEISEFLRKNGIAFSQNTRKVISPKELDFHLPEHNLAIEFDGLYWHSSKFVDKNYHAEKTAACQKQGIQLLHIFEDEWENSSSVLKKKILHLCGKTPTIVTGARKLVIAEATKSEITSFVNENHVQGVPLVVTHYLKITYNGEIVAVVLLKKIANNIVDMIRFCTNQSGTYPGLMSKVVSYVKKQYNYAELVTFADLRYSYGDVYLKSGFTEVNRLKPDYFYVIGDKREHKFNLRKDRIEKRFGITAEGKTEYQMAAEAGIVRIYDCGKIKYSMTLV